MKEKKDKMKIDENVIRKIIEETIKKVLKEEYGDLNLNSTIVGKMFFVENKTDFLKYAIPVWNQLTLSYQNIGGLKSYRDYQDFLKKQHYIRIVLDNNGNVLACATYRRIENSFKMVAIGCNQESSGKKALEQIIQFDIKNMDLHCWAEVSGAIEHYFKKYNGYPMPNTLAGEILNVPNSNIILSNVDNVHYERPIGQNQEVYLKMIYGIKNQEIFEKAIAEVENYSKFMEEVNKMETISESVLHYNIKQAMYIVDNIYRAHEEDGFNELIPSWHHALVESLKTLEAQPKSKMIEDYIQYCKYLLDDMQLLELHYFN